MMYERMLLTLDGSPLAEQALQHAVELAKAFRAELHLVKVVTPFGPTLPQIEMDFGETYRQAALQEAHEYLTRVKERLTPNITSVHTKVIEGVVVDAILDYADFQGIDVIVMATHGRSGVGRWVFGSVAERVLHAANVPVFLIRAKEQPTEAVTNGEHAQA